MSEDETQPAETREELTRGGLVQHAETVAEYAIAVGGVKAIELGMEAGVNKIKDLRSPQEDAASKIVLPPGAQRE